MHWSRNERSKRRPLQATCRVSDTWSCIFRHLWLMRPGSSPAPSVSVMRLLRSIQHPNHAEIWLYTSLENQWRTIVKHILQQSDIFKAFICSARIPLEPFKLWDSNNISRPKYKQFIKFTSLRKTLLTFTCFCMVLLWCIIIKMQKDCTYYWILFTCTVFP